MSQKDKALTETDIYILMHKEYLTCQAFTSQEQLLSFNLTFVPFIKKIGDLGPCSLLKVILDRHLYINAHKIFNMPGIDKSGATPKFQFNFPSL